jgi:hypothetical protein
MVMKPTPSAPVEVPKTKLLFEILVVALDAPPHFGNVNEPLCRCIFGQCREPVFGRLGFAKRPLNQQAFLVARSGAPIITVWGPHAQRRKSRAQCGVFILFVLNLAVFSAAP